MPPRSVAGSHESWKRVAGAVRSRRSDLGERSVDQVIELSRRHSPRGVSRSVVSFVENARQLSYAERTLRALSVGLDWSPDSIERLLQGDDPLPYVNQATVEMAGGHDLTPDEQAKVEAFVQGLLAARKD